MRSSVVLEAGRTTDGGPRGDRPAARGRPRGRRAQQDRPAEGPRRAAAADGRARGALPVRGHRAGERRKGPRARRAAGRGRGRLLPVAPAIYGADEITDRDERFLAAEFVREKIFRLLGEEVPYATTVTIDSFVHEGDAAPDPRHGPRRPRKPARHPAGRGRRADEGDRARPRAPTWSACSAARSTSRCG